MDMPSRCPVCGSTALPSDFRVTSLLAVSEVLALKALEKIGSRLVRANRARFNELDGRPFYIAHTLWPTDDEETLQRALKGAWDVVPALLADTSGPAAQEQVISMLNGYVLDLAITGTPHTLEELSYRFTSRLGLPVHMPPRIVPNEEDEVTGVR